MNMYIREEDKNPELYTETYDKWEDWMAGEVVYFDGLDGPELAVVSGKCSEMSLWAMWENYQWESLSIYVGDIKFKKRKGSKVEVLAVKTVAIPTEIEFEGRVYVLKESV